MDPNAGAGVAEAPNAGAPNAEVEGAVPPLPKADPPKAGFGAVPPDPNALGAAEPADAPPEKAPNPVAGAVEPNPVAGLMTDPPAPNAEPVEAVPPCPNAEGVDVEPNADGLVAACPNAPKPPEPEAGVPNGVVVVAV